MSDESAGGTGTNTPIVIQEPPKADNSNTLQHHRRFLHHSSGPDAKGGSRHRYFHHNGQRIRQFVRADGRKVHVASSPGEVEKMRRKMAVVDNDFDLVVHGSEEHVRGQELLPMSNCLITMDYEFMMS